MKHALFLALLLRELAADCPRQCAADTNCTECARELPFVPYSPWGVGTMKCGGNICGRGRREASRRYARSPRSTSPPVSPAAVSAAAIGFYDDLPWQKEGYKGGEQGDGVTPGGDGVFGGTEKHPKAKVPEYD